MKKTLIAILAVLYISTSSGAVVHLHYCMGELADWGLGQNKSKTCGQCGMKKAVGKDSGCCKDEHKFLKNSSDQKIVKLSFQLMEAMAGSLLPGCTELHSIQISSVTEENPISNAPPRSSPVAVYILDRTFLI